MRNTFTQKTRSCMAIC